MRQRRLVSCSRQMAPGCRKRLKHPRGRGPRRHRHGRSQRRRFGRPMRELLRRWSRGLRRGRKRRHGSRGHLSRSKGVRRRSKTAWVDLAEQAHQPPSLTEPASSTVAASCSAALHKAPWLKHGCTLKFQILYHGNHSVALKNL